MGENIGQLSPIHTIAWIKFSFISFVAKGESNILKDLNISKNFKIYLLLMF